MIYGKNKLWRPEGRRGKVLKAPPGQFAARGRLVSRGRGSLRQIAIIGCGFVADLYMASLAVHPDIRVLGVHDRNPDRARRFANHWNLTVFDSLQMALDALPAGGIVVNLTNPSAHFEINHACLAAGHHVYSEKPLALGLQDAQSLVALAEDKGLMLASAPCSVLGEAAQMLAAGVRDGVAGRPRLVYAELDDGWIPQAPYKQWQSESGTPWPYEDEFRVGCTLEHAGYYLTWLIAMFGTVRTVVAASSEVIDEKEGGPYGTPDVSVATLFFECGVVARLTCSIVAPHDHQIRIFGDKGVLSVRQAWANGAAVSFRKRIRIRRRLIESPVARRLKPGGKTHPKVGRRGAASMNFALGLADMFDAAENNRAPRLSGALALHLTEVTLAIQNAGEDTGAQRMTTRCAPMEPMPWAR